MGVLATISLEDVRDDEDGHFYAEHGLAVLLAEGVVILNNSWWRDDLSDRDKSLCRAAVVCNDTFGYACADAEALPFHGVKPLFEAWEADRDLGPCAWSITQRRQQPIDPVAKALTARGYDVGALVEGTLHTPSPRPQHGGGAE